MIALLIGILFSVISFVTQFDSTPLTPPPLEVLLAFGIGVWWLLASMCMEIITYLSSQYRIGLHGSVGEVLSDASYSIGLPEHIRNVLGTYSFVIGQNQQVIEANVFWFRLTLLFLLYGVLFVAVSGFLYIGGFGRTTALIGVAVASIASLGVGYCILSGRFLPLHDEGENNE